MRYDYDVIIVGGGGAGLAAAHQILEREGRVLILDAGRQLGGSTSLSGGHIYAAGTSVQRAKGITDDTPEDAFRYYMTLNQFKLEPAPVRALCEEAPQVVEWLIGLGVAFPVDDLHPGGVDPTPREHCPVGNGAAIVAALEAAIGEAPDVALQCRVEKLLFEDGKVCGVIADGTEVRAPAVIVSSGGFGANPALLQQYYPDATRHGDWTWYIGRETSQGDHLALGAAVGAEITGHNRGLLLATPGLRKELEIGGPSWLVYVNSHGRRFAPETLPYNVMAGVLKEQPGEQAFAIFDDAARATSAPDPHILEQVRAGLRTTSWMAEDLDRFIEDGKIARADTLEGLARQMGIHWPALQVAIDRYNEACEAGEDRQFGKRASAWKPVRTAPFYGVPIRPAVVCFTSTGLRIDEHARVLDEEGRAIAGLYAAGESAGGVLGDRIFGGGSSMAHALCFGRIAGRSAIRHTRRHNAP